MNIERELLLAQRQREQMTKVQKQFVLAVSERPS
jgi:hypothetical protein